jgi:hypothetical protein
MLSPDKTEEMHHAIARHLGDLKRQFDGRLLDKATVENGDETHVTINMDNGRCLAAIGDDNVTHADVVSGEPGMTHFVRLSGGATSVIMQGFVIFQSAGDYPLEESRITFLVSRIELAPDCKVMAEYLEKSEPFGRWRKKRNGFCTWITVEGVIRQQSQRKPSVGSGRPCATFLQIVLT